MPIGQSPMRRCGSNRKGRRGRAAPAARVPSAISNGDLTAEILSRLPARSVIRFTSVCKAWLSLVSDPSFLQSHTRRNPHLSRRVAGLYSYQKGVRSGHPRYGFDAFPLDEDEGGSIPVPIAPLPLPSHSPMFNWERSCTRFGRPCNGLFLCYEYMPYTVRIKYYVYNPTTKAVAVILLPDVPRRDNMAQWDGRVDLVFDPVRFPDRYRLFYKYETGEDLFGASVYSSESRSWSVCSPEQGFEVVVDDMYAFFSPGVYWNGALNYKGVSDLVWFSVEGDLLDAPKHLPLPRHKSKYFGESGGRLYFVDAVGPREQLRIWEMEQDYSGWSRLYKVNLSSVRDVYQFSSLFLDITPLFVLPESAKDPDRRMEQGPASSSTSRDGDVLVLSIEGKILSYNLGQWTPEKAYSVLRFQPRNRYFDPDSTKILPFAYTLFPP